MTPTLDQILMALARARYMRRQADAFNRPNARAWQIEETWLIYERDKATA